jgi:hypothetical protein
MFLYYCEFDMSHCRFENCVTNSSTSINGGFITINLFSLIYFFCRSDYFEQQHFRKDLLNGS